MQIFHSIRGRLIAGFTLLTLLTVTLLGILVLSLMQQYVARQEIDYLEQNAIALARQSEHYFTTTVLPPALSSLARTASLLGNFQVRILDAEEVPLVDSAQAPVDGHFTWLVAAGSEPRTQSEHASYDVPAAREDFDIFFIEADEIAVDKIIDASREWITPNAVSPPRVDTPDHLQELARPPTHVRSADRPMPRMLRIVRQRRGEWGPLLRFEVASDEFVDLSGDNITDLARVDAYVEEQIVEWESTVEEVPITSIPNAVPRVHGGTHTQPLPSPIPSETIHVRSLSVWWQHLWQHLWPRLPRQRVVTPINVQQGIVGYVELSSTPGIATEALAALRRLFVLAAAGVSLIAVGVGLVMSRTLTAPIHLLADATNRMNNGDLSARAAVHSNDEIGQLAAAFNRMAAALEQSFRDLAAERDALRHFVADASHELRTPITALRTFTDLLRDGSADAPTQAEFLTESAGQIQRLERLTENLLNLSRFDGGLVELDRVECSVAELIKHVVALLRPLALERSITLAIALPQGNLTIACDRQQMERALTNLVENALKFTPNSGQVRVGAIVHREATELWVEDTGIGIAAAEQVDIFRRFYRGQNATNDGSGLGLAIAQSILTAHGGTVTVESVEGQGSRFTLCW